MDSIEQEPGILDRDKMITTEELATYLADTPIGTLDQWARRGGGPVFHKVGIRRLYDPVDVKEWLKARRHGNGKAQEAPAA